MGRLLLVPLVGVLGSVTDVSATPLLQPDAAADTVEIAIRAVAGIRFDRVRFQVEPGQTVRLVVTNDDELADMPHNLVVTSPGARMQVVQAAAQVGAENNYVPTLPEVMFSTPLLAQGESFELTFTAPSQNGAYPYACTFPGHGFTMYGVMYVGQEMPPLAQDENVPPAQRVAQDGDTPGKIRGLSYGTRFPAVSRTFMPESGPASIAVGFADGQAFNFDAGEVYLRYAWSGGFVDNSKHWAGNGNAFAEVQGSIYYRSQVGFPLRIGGRQTPEDVQFHGYRLVEGGYPEFRYTVDGVEVRELVRERSEGPGLVRTFQVRSSEPVRFLTDPGSGVKFQASVGRWKDGTLELTPAEARQFVVTMIPGVGGTR